jgi:hypothetical protein
LPRASANHRGAAAQEGVAAPNFLLYGGRKMKLKNIGNKIVSVSEVVILPGETKEVSGYDENSALEYLIRQGNLSIVKERTTVKKE